MRGGISWLLSVLVVSCSAPVAPSGGGVVRSAAEPIHLCTLLGCGPTFTLVLDLPTDLDALRRCTLTVCANGRCLGGPLGEFAPQGCANCRNISFPEYAVRAAGPTPYVEMDLRADRANHQYLSVHWFPEFDGMAENGDTYSVAIRDPSGRALLDFRKNVVAYVVQEPNGPGCGTCRYSVFDQRVAAKP